MAVYGDSLEQVALRFSALDVDPWTNPTKEELKKRGTSVLAQHEPCLCVWQANASRTHILAATQKTGSNNPSKCFIALPVTLCLYRKPRAAAAPPPLTSTYLPSYKWKNKDVLRWPLRFIKSWEFFSAVKSENKLPSFTLLSCCACWNGFHLAVSLDTHWPAWTLHVLQILEEFSYDV